MSPSLRGKARATMPLVFALSFASGCASLPPLDDAAVTQVTLASGNDIAAYNRAHKEHYSSRGGPLPRSAVTPTDRYPILKVSFTTPRQLVGPDDHFHLVMLDFCEGGDRNAFIGSGSQLVWRGQILSPGNAPAVKKSPARGQPQHYVLLLNYWFDGSDPETIGPVLPAPSDLCISFGELLMIAPTRRGKPLRIDKDVVNRVIAPFLKEQPDRTR